MRHATCCATSIDIRWTETDLCVQNIESKIPLKRLWRRATEKNIQKHVGCSDMLGNISGYHGTSTSQEGSNISYPTIYLSKRFYITPTVSGCYIMGQMENEL